MTRIRPRHAAAVTALALVGLAAGGCGQVRDALATPFIEDISDCSPQVEAGLCRRIAEAAVWAIEGPAVSASGLSVSQWDSCQNEQVVGFAPGAAQGKVCYSVMGSGYAGGERLAPMTYRGGTPVEIEAVVWSDKDGTLHAAVKATPLEMVPQP